MDRRCDSDSGISPVILVRSPVIKATSVGHALIIVRGESRFEKAVHGLGGLDLRHVSDPR
jgi:hypothetical protein